VEANLEPACVIVCPTQAIIAGDLDNPASTASRMVETEKVSVRKPYKGTEPKLYYKGIEGDLLEPARLSRQSTYVFADQRDQRPTQQTFDPKFTREVYDVSHPAPWGWKIAAYLWTKSIAAGVMLVAAISLVLSPAAEPPIANIAAPVIALGFLAATMALLIFDLKRPDRFFYLFTKANTKSWLVLGGYILMLYGIALVLWLLAGIFLEHIPRLLVWITMLLAMASAGYSASLFAQARGRDLWQTRLFLWHLIVQAFLAGSAALVLVEWFGESTAWDDYAVAVVSAIALLLSPGVSLALILFETFRPHHSQDSRLAVNQMIKGRFKISFWGLTIGLGHVLPLLLFSAAIWLDTDQLYPAIASLVLLGLWFYENLWVKAGPSVPLS